MKMKMKSWMKVPAVLMIGAGLTFVMPAAAAVGESSPPSSAVRIEAKQVALLANGLAIKVPVRYVCPVGGTPNLQVSISAISHKTILTASAFFQGKPCTGAFQHTVAILAVQGERFKPGPALGQAEMFQCSFGGCTNSTDARALQLM